MLIDWVWSSQMRRDRAKYIPVWPSRSVNKYILAAVKSFKADVSSSSPSLVRMTYSEVRIIFLHTRENDFLYFHSPATRGVLITCSGHWVYWLAEVSFGGRAALAPSIKNGFVVNAGTLSWGRHYTVRISNPATIWTGLYTSGSGIP